MLVHMELYKITSAQFILICCFFYFRLVCFSKTGSVFFCERGEHHATQLDLGLCRQPAFSHVLMVTNVKISYKQLLFFFLTVAEPPTHFLPNNEDVSLPSQKKKKKKKRKLQRFGAQTDAD